MENKTAIEAAKAAKRQYAKEWRDRNRDKCKKYQERYWLKRAAEMAAGGDADAANENH